VSSFYSIYLVTIELGLYKSIRSINQPLAAFGCQPPALYTQCIRTVLCTALYRLINAYSTILTDITYRFKVNSLALLLLTLVDLLTYVYYIREYRASISSVEDRREFITNKGRLVIGGKGFIVNRRKYITVYKRE
jgi:hypothetical protein